MKKHNLQKFSNIKIVVSLRLIQIALRIKEEHSCVGTVMRVRQNNTDRINVWYYMFQSSGTSNRTRGKVQLYECRTVDETERNYIFIFSDCTKHQSYLRHVAGISKWNVTFLVRKMLIKTPFILT